MTKARKQWWLYGFFGAFFLGGGATVAIEAGFWKHDGSPWSWWVFGGILGLSFLVIGAVFLVRAGVIHERLQQQKKQQ